MEVKAPLRTMERASLDPCDVRIFFFSEMVDWTNMAGSVNRVRRPVAIPKAAKLKNPSKKLSLKFVTNPLRIMTMRANKLVVATKEKR